MAYQDQLDIIRENVKYLNTACSTFIGIEMIDNVKLRNLLHDIQDYLLLVENEYNSIKHFPSVQTNFSVSLEIYIEFIKSYMNNLRTMIDINSGAVIPNTTLEETYSNTKQLNIIIKQKEGEIVSGLYDEEHSL